jgi:hypothetical protein
MGAAGRGPTPEQINEMQGLEKKLARAEKIDFVMLTISMLAMATARYLTF